MKKNSKQFFLESNDVYREINRRKFLCTTAKLGLGMVVSTIPGATLLAGNNSINKQVPNNKIIKNKTNSMIQFFALIPKKEGISKQEFHDHWRHPHGTMGRNIPTLRSYVQSHQIETDLLGADQHLFEGIAESTFDTLQDAQDFGNEPYYKSHIQPDEPNFVHGPGLQWLNTEEEVLTSKLTTEGGANFPDALWLYLNHPISYKILQFIRPDGNPSWAEENDAELGLKIGAVRHVRNYSLGTDPFYIGVRQLWWPTLSAFEEGVKKNPKAFKQLLGQAGSSLTILAQAERLLR